MADGNTDERVLGTIKKLVEEEHALLNEKDREPHAHARLDQ